MVNRFGRSSARLTVAVAIIMALALKPAAHANPMSVPARGYGFSQGSSIVWMSMDDVNRELDAAAETTASWLRVLIDWSRIEPRQGQFNWDYVDGVINAASDRNLQVLGLIAYTPEWARPAGSYFTAPPVDPAGYGRFAAAVVHRYGDRVSNWELWNEPNLPLFFGFTKNNGARYTELMKAAYPAIKSVQPNSTVVAAGLSRLLGEDSPPAFLEQMYSAGAAGFFDAAAAHPYVSPSGLAADEENGWSDVGRMHEVMVAHGDGAKKIWMTELGAPTSDTPEGVSRWAQAEQIAEVLAAVAATSYGGPAFIYSIRDIASADRREREHNYGALLTSDWQPKFTARVLAK